jgi:hypothetical protein
MALVIGALIVGALLTGGLRPEKEAHAEAGAVYKLLMPFVPKKLNTGPGTVIGRVVDATTNATPKYGGVKVCYGTRCANANANGDFSLSGVPYGLRELKASANYYFDLKSTVYVNGGGTSVLNFAIFPSGVGGTRAMQIVLQWRSERTWPGQGCLFEGNPDPSGNCLNDMDSHLWVIPINPALPRYHLHPRNKGNCDQSPSACIEIDQQWGSGPETMTIAAYEDVIYHYVVHSVWQYISLTVPHISDTQAHVQVYKIEFGNSQIVLDKLVPVTGGSRDLEAWHVFTLNGQSGVLTLTNCLTTLWGSDLTPPTCP